MPELPEVTERFEADTGPYVAGLQAMIAAAQRAEDANLSLRASIDLVSEGMEATAGRAEALAGADTRAAEATGRLRDEAAALDGILEAVGHQTDELALQTQVLDAGFARLDGQLDDVIAHLAAYGTATAAAAAETDAAATATNKVSSAQRHGLGWFRLTATGWHWLITGATEYLAVAVPGTLALAAGLAVDAEAAIDVANHMKDVYEVTHATAGVFHDSVSSVLGLSGAFQKAAEAAKPQVYSDLGNALDIARERTGGLAQAGLQVSGIFDKFMAKMAYDFSSSGPFGKPGGLMSSGVSDLTEFGQILGNLGHALDDFAAKTPGIAEGLLQFADAASKVVVWISELPKPLIESAIIFHEFTMWGSLAWKVLERFGLATSVLGSGAMGGYKALTILENVFKAIPTAAANALTGVGNLAAGFRKASPEAVQFGANIRNAGEDMKLAIADIPAGVAALGAVGLAGIVAMIVALQRSKTAAQQFSDSLQQAADKASNMQVMNVLSRNMAELAPRTQQATSALNQYSGAVDHAAIGGKAAAGVLTVLRGNQDAYKAALSATQVQMDNVQRGADYLSKRWGVTYTQALGLATAAGVKLNKGILGNSEAAQQARNQVEGLVHGYQAMGQAGGALGTDMAAFQIQTGLAATRVSQLNQALDGFMSNATGLTSTVSAFNQDVTEIGNNGVKAGKSFQTFNGQVVSSVQATALALRSFQGTGAQVWQNYDSALQSAEQYTDQLRTSAAYGVITQTAFRQQIAYTAQQLLPYAQYSKAATSELSALTQEAGGKATDNFQTLKAWVDKNSESTKNFNKQTSNETTALSNASKMAAQFAGTLNSDVVAALDQAQVSTAGVTESAQDFDQAWRNAHGTISGPVKASLSQLFTSLMSVTHNTSQARQMIDTYGHQMGMTDGQIKTINGLLDQMAHKLAALHSRKISVETVFTQVGSLPGAAAQGAGGRAGPSGFTAQTGASQTAGGVHLVGELGPELVHLPTGTGVTPSWQTAPLLQGGGGGGGQMTVNLHVDSYIGGEKVASQQRTQVLTYSRRNTGNNLTLRTR